MKEIILFGLLFIVIGFIIDYLLKEKFDIDKKRNDMSKSAKRVQRIVINSIWLIFIVFLVMLVGRNEEFNFMFILIPYFVIIFTFRTMMEWLYNRRANLWISSLSSLLLVSSYFILIILLH